MAKNSINTHRRGELRRKLRAVNAQQTKFDAQTERLIKSFTKKK